MCSRLRRGMQSFVDSRSSRRESLRNADDRKLTSAPEKLSMSTRKSSRSGHEPIAYPWATAHPEPPARFTRVVTCMPSANSQFDPVLSRCREPLGRSFGVEKLTDFLLWRTTRTTTFRSVHRSDPDSSNRCLHAGRRSGGHGVTGHGAGGQGRLRHGLSPDSRSQATARSNVRIPLAE